MNVINKVPITSQFYLKAENMKAILMESNLSTLNVTVTLKEGVAKVLYSVEPPTDGLNSKIARIILDDI